MVCNILRQRVFTIFILRHYLPSNNLQVPRNGILPASVPPFDKTTKLEKQFDQVVEWFTNDTFNYDMALLYFWEPDTTGHNAGPDSENITFVLKYIDEKFGEFVEKLKRKGVFDEVYRLMI